jgi:hypothetical protein
MWWSMMVLIANITAVNNVLKLLTDLKYPPNHPSWPWLGFFGSHGVSPCNLHVNVRVED